MMSKLDGFNLKASRVLEVSILVEWVLGVQTRGGKTTFVIVRTRTVAGGRRVSATVMKRRGEPFGTLFEAIHDRQIS